MHRVFFAAVEIVPAAIVLFPVFGILYITVYGSDLKKCVCDCLFCLYLSAVFALVGIPNVIYFRPEVNLNLIPFVGMIADLKNCVLNIVLFVPLGFFLPVRWQKFRKWTASVAFGVGLSLVIELLQMLTLRATDVNDLITNTVGTLLGFLTAKVITRKASVIGKEKWDVYRLTALSFGVMFFAQPFLSPLIRDRLH